MISQSGEQKGKQTVLQEFFTKKSVDPGDHAAESICQSRISEQKSIAFSQSTEHVWSVKDAATKQRLLQHYSLLPKTYHSVVLKT